jgi:hypothetical protein
LSGKCIYTAYLLLKFDVLDCSRYCSGHFQVTEPENNGDNKSSDESVKGDHENDQRLSANAVEVQESGDKTISPDLYVRPILWLNQSK